MFFAIDALLFIVVIARLPYLLSVCQKLFVALHVKSNETYGPSTEQMFPASFLFRGREIFTVLFPA